MVGATLLVVSICSLGAMLFSMGMQWHCSRRHEERLQRLVEIHERYADDQPGRHPSGMFSDTD